MNIWESWRKQTKQMTRQRYCIIKKWPITVQYANTSRGALTATDPAGFPFKHTSECTCDIFHLSCRYRSVRSRALWPLHLRPCGLPSRHPVQTGWDAGGFSLRSTAQNKHTWALLTFVMVSNHVCNTTSQEFRPVLSVDLSSNTV